MVISGKESTTPGVTSLDSIISYEILQKLTVKVRVLDPKYDENIREPLLLLKSSSFSVVRRPLVRRLGFLIFTSGLLAQINEGSGGLDLLVLSCGLKVLQDFDCVLGGCLPPAHFDGGCLIESAGEARDLTLSISIGLQLHVRCR